MPTEELSLAFLKLKAYLCIGKIEKVYQIYTKSNFLV